MSKHLHIICDKAPWPADNSVAIDTLCKMEALHQQGVKIHLHYFYTAEGAHPNELNKYCESIHPHPCNKTAADLPGTVNAGCEKMAAFINSNDFPILFEGLNGTGILKKIRLEGRKIIVRMHNDECRYAKHVAKFTSPFLFFQKNRWNRHSREMKKYEDHLPQECLYAFSTAEDLASSKEDHDLTNAHHLPAFTPHTEIKSQTGIGNFCLYHGDLSDPCNEKAALWLLTKIFNDIQTPFVIAGKNPGNQVIKMAELYAHSCLITNPSVTELEDLVSKAQIHVLPSFSNKKPELKLMNALYNGRHCVVNKEAIEGSAFEGACHVAATSNAFKSIILQLYHRPFEDEEIKLRNKIIWEANIEQPTKKLVQWLYN